MARKSSPHLPLLEKALVQAPRRPCFFRSEPDTGGKFGEEVGFILQGIRVLLLEILLPLKGCRGFVDQVDICIGN